MATCTSLIVAADGLLQTHVTWEDVQEKAVKIWGPSAVFGPNKSVTNIGENGGFMSRMCLIDPDWCKTKGIPKKFVIKIVSGLAMAEAHDKIHSSAEAKEKDAKVDPQILVAMESQMRNMHATELRLYNLLMKYEKPGFVHPKIFHQEPFTDENRMKGYIIMEYIEGIQRIPIYENISLEDIKQPLRAMAAFGALSFNFNDEERGQMAVNPLRNFFATVFTKETIDQTIKVLRTFGGEALMDKVDHLETIIHEMIELPFYEDINKRIDMPLVMAHGDLWSNNMIWNCEANGKLKLRAIIDFQTAHLGVATADIARLLSCSLSGKDRQANWESLLKLFYAYLKEEVGKGVKIPYTYEQCKESYQQFFPLAAFLVVPMIGPIFMITAANPDPEVKNKMMDVIIEKVSALLDDMFDAHDRNLKIKTAAIGK